MTNNITMSNNIQLSTNKFKIWWDTTRWVALPQSAMPALLAGVLALDRHSFNLLNYCIAFLGIMVVHLGTNLLDDYGDLKIGGFHHREDVQNLSSDPIRTAKAPYVQNGDITLNQLLYVSLGLFAAGLTAGIYLTIKSGWPVAAIAFAGALICFFYSMPPLKLSYHGLGEFVVSIAMGPGICLGTYYATTGTFDWAPILISIPVGILIGQILFIHSVMDFQPDTAVNKKTLVAILGTQAKAISLLPYLLVICYGSIIIGAATSILPLTTLIVLLTLPMAVGFLNTTDKLQKGNYEAIKTKWWMGPMEQMISGHEWFLITWRQARNLLIFFTLLLFLAYGISQLH
jgi:1,4-dihydroxy-2-naphthoate polyprenyltransferase